MQWLLLDEVFKYHCNIKNKEKMFGLVLPTTQQLEIYCVWRESGHFFFLNPSLKAQKKAQQKQVLRCNFKKWTGHLLRFNLIERPLSKEHRTFSKLIHQAQILGHNPSVRLTVIRTIRTKENKHLCSSGWTGAPSSASAGELHSWFQVDPQAMADEARTPKVSLKVSAERD